MSVRRTILCVSMAVLLGLTTGNAQAELLVHDTFSVGSGGYTAGPLDTAGSPATIGLTGSWTNGDPFYVGTDANNDTAAAGERAVFHDPSLAGPSYSIRSSSIPGTAVYTNSGDTFYASFVIEPPLTTAGMYFDMMFSKLDDTGSAALRLGIKNDKYFVANAGAESTSGRYLSVGEVAAESQRIVAKIEYNASGNNERITLWINPTDESSPTIAYQDTSANVLNNGGGKLTEVYLRATDTGGNPAYFDDLRLSTTFDEVVPEPSTWAMVCVAAATCLGIIRRRRRRRG